MTEHNRDSHLPSRKTARGQQAPFAPEVNMDRWRFATILAMCILATGCQSGAELRTQLLERELRMQEDCIYDLEAQLDSAERRLEATRRENEALRREKGAPAGSSSSGSRDEGYYEPPTVSIPPTVSAPAVESNIPFVPLPDAGPLEEAPPYQGPPTVDPIDPAAPPVTPPPPPTSGVELLPDGSASVEGEQTPLKRLQFLMRSQAVEPEETDFHITSITLNRMLTGGYDLDNCFGDEGVMVVVEPRNAANRIVNAPAQVSIVLLDPALPPPSARVARWDFTADEAANHFRRGRLGKGMYFQLPWPDRLPDQQELQLHVRVITTDGKELRANRTVTIDIPGRPSHRWTTAAGARDSAATSDALGHEYAAEMYRESQQPTLALAEEAEVEPLAEPQPLPALSPREAQPVQAVSGTVRHDAAPLPPATLEAAANGLVLAEEVTHDPSSAGPLDSAEPRRLELGSGANAPRPLTPEPTTARRGSEWSPYR